MRVLILSDIHGNLSALKAVLEDAKNRFHPDSAILLGDNIDYGPRSNEVIEEIKNINIPIICSVWGNHEYAIMNQEYLRFSSERGVQSAKKTEQELSNNTRVYLENIEGKLGKKEIEIAGKRMLVVHGSLMDPLWGGITVGGDFAGYDKYDYVLSGHTHYAHIFPVFYTSENKAYRNKKRTLFINPGSVGQPRNHDARAQYAILDFNGDVALCGVEYDVQYEQSLFDESVDSFYKERLITGV